MNEDNEKDDFFVKTNAEARWTDEIVIKRE